MASITNTISNAYNDAYNCVANQVNYVNESISNRVNSVYKATTDAMQSACDTVNNSIAYAKDSTMKALNDTQSAIANFVDQNSQELLFLGSTIVTLALNPSVAIPVFFATMVIRLIVEPKLKDLAYEYLRHENNPYHTNEKYKVVTEFDYTIGVLAAIDAIALATFVTSNLNFVNMFPLAGAVIAGSSAAKLIMNLMSDDNVKTPENENLGVVDDQPGHSTDNSFDEVNANKNRREEIAAEQPGADSSLNTDVSL